MRLILALLSLIAVVSLARAQEASDPSVALHNDWIAAQVGLGHLGSDIQALDAHVRTLATQAKETDDRLKWVLDNWVPKPAKK